MLKSERQKILLATGAITLTQLACGMREVLTLGIVGVGVVGIVGLVVYLRDPETLSKIEDRRLAKEYRDSENGVDKTPIDDFNGYAYVQLKLARQTEAQNQFSKSEAIPPEVAEYVTQLVSTENIGNAIMKFGQLRGIEEYQIREYLTSDHGKKNIQELAHNVANTRLAATSNRSLKYTKFFVLQTFNTMDRIIFEAKKYSKQ